jgi:uncharacterized protein YcbK (DUF882 family)
MRRLSSSALPHSRRQFLRGAGALAVALVPAAALARATPSRTLALVHTHTGERLQSTYYRDGEYLPEELARLNHLLRDVRTGDVYPIAPATLDILADLRALAASDAPYEVICGYRSAHTNALLREHSHGVAEHSLHLKGRAIDVRLPGVATARLRDLALNMARGGVGYYAQEDFIHLDNGALRHW